MQQQTDRSQIKIDPIFSFWETFKSKKKSKNRQKSVLILEDVTTKLWKEGKR